jgi:hypothetical protein
MEPADASGGSGSSSLPSTTPMLVWLRNAGAAISSHHPVR